MIAKSAGQMVASPGLRDKWLNSGTIPENPGWLASLHYSPIMMYHQLILLHNTNSIVNVHASTCIVFL